MSSYLVALCATLLLGHNFVSTVIAQPPERYDAAPPRLVVMTWNVEWMFDHDQADNRSDLSKQQSAPSEAYWNWKVAAVADAIAKSDATIVALQEIENERTLLDIAKVLREQHRITYRAAFVPGTDTFTEQDVGILQRSGLTNFRRYEQSKSMFDSGQFYNLSKQVTAEFRWKNSPVPLTVMNVHVRATAEAEAERTKQGRLAKFFLAPQLEAGEDVIILGDLNSEHAVGDIAGEMKELLEPSEISPAPMVDLLQFAPEEKRRTHLILDKQFDRIVVSRSLVEDQPGVQDWVFAHIAVHPEWNVRGQSADTEAHWNERLTMSLEELDVSDHHPVVATFELR